MIDDITSTALSTVGSTSTDVFVLLAVFLLLSVWGFLRGREVLLAAILALYPAMLMTGYFPYEYLSGMHETYARLVVCAGVAIAGAWALRRHLQSSYFLGGPWKWVEVLVLAICVTGLAGTALYHSVDLGTVYAFSAVFDTLFLSPTMHIAWLAAPLICIPVVIRT